MTTRRGGVCIGCGYKVCKCLELHLERDLKALGLIGFEREYAFAPGRRYRADFAWPDARLLVEVEGGTWTANRTGHTSGAGYERDCEKYNLATRLGFSLLRFTSSMVRDGRAVREIELFFNGG